MATLTSGRILAGVRPNTPMDFLAAGCGLTRALVGLFVMNFALSFSWPAGSSHAWTKLFAPEPDNLSQAFMEGILGSAVAA